MLLGELGGLLEVIVHIPPIFISYLVQLQFMSAVADLMPVKKKDDSILQPIASGIREQLIELENTQEMPTMLSADDAESLALEASKITKMPKVPLVKKLYQKCFCKTDRWIETQKHVFNEFESKLDV